ncbi:MAG: hypothetical protein QNJ90_14735 [Planctomycetota bacterium]|nr:hypothetical protein [Planctomycetota bacterium]
MRSTARPCVSSTTAVLGSGRLLGVLLLAAALLVPAAGWGPLGGSAYAEDGKDDAKKAEAEKDGDEKKPARAARKPILPVIQENPKRFKDLVEAARQYFDLDEEQWKGRTALMAELTKFAKEGLYFLKDMDALRWLVYEGRSFDPQLNNRKWQKAVGAEEHKKLGGTLAYIKADDLITATYSVPRSYWKLKDFRSKSPRPAPLPLLITMHEKRDSRGKKYPGAELLKRLWPRKEWKDLYDNWLILSPTAAAGNYLTKAGTVRGGVFTNQFTEFWRHYHVDYDRVILDGNEQAFTVASSMPIFFAGIVLRGKWTLEDDAQKELVQNFGPVPVYVVQNPKLAKQLEEAGHTQVTAGIGGPTLMKWMNERRREAPKKFSWIVQKMRYDQALPYWINIDSPNMAAPKRQLKVEILEKENTIRMEAEGITTLSLFLNDDLVDLDRKLRVELNGHVEYDQVVPLVDERMSTVGRDFDFLFNRDPIKIRESMYFGWLLPTRIVSISVRPPRKEEPKKDEKKDEGPKASPDDIRRAGRFLQRAKIFHEKGNDKRALEQIEKVLELPETEHHAEARKLKKDLEAKAPK